MSQMSVVYRPTASLGEAIDKRMIVATDDDGGVTVTLYPDPQGEAVSGWSSTELGSIDRIREALDSIRLNQYLDPIEWLFLTVRESEIAAHRQFVVGGNLDDVTTFDPEWHSKLAQSCVTMSKSLSPI